MTNNLSLLNNNFFDNDFLNNSFFDNSFNDDFFKDIDTSNNYSYIQTQSYFDNGKGSSKKYESQLYKNNSGRKKMFEKKTINPYKENQSMTYIKDTLNNRNEKNIHNIDNEHLFRNKWNSYLDCSKYLQIKNIKNTLENLQKQKIKAVNIENYSLANSIKSRQAALKNKLKYI